MTTENPEDGNRFDQLWSGMDRRSAAWLKLMNWKPHSQAAHATCNFKSAFDDEDSATWSSLSLPPEALRECAKALEDAAEWLEKRAKEKHL